MKRIAILALSGGIMAFAQAPTPQQSTPRQMPREAMPGQSTPSQSTPSQSTPSQSTPSQAMPGQSTPGQMTPGETTPGQPGRFGQRGRMGRPGERGAGYERRLESMMTDLNLTDTQKQQARTLFQQSAEKSRPIRAQMEKNQEAVWDAVKANDAAKIQQLANEHGQLRGQLLTIHADTRAKFVSMLTPEQKTKFESMHPGPGMGPRSRSRQP